MATLGEISLIAGRYGSSEPAEPYTPYKPRYLRISDIDDLGRLRTDRRASLSFAKAAPHMLAPGDLLIARSGASVGKSHLVGPLDGMRAHAGYLIRFRLDPGQCVPAYVAHYVRSPTYWAWVRRTQRQAAQPNINAQELCDLPVPLPSRLEQRDIARVLTAVDKLVYASTRVLARYREIKRGLVAELMTRGVATDRPGRQQRPPDETYFARLPPGWRVAQVGDLLADRPHAMRSGPFGSQLKKRDLSSHGVPLLGIDNVHIDRFVPEYKRFVSPQTFHRLAQFQVFPGDVMITVMGTVGRACVVPQDIDRALSSKHVWTLTFDDQRYLGILAALQFNHAPWVREHFERDEQGGIMTAIRSDTLRTIPLPVPPMAEQRRIAGILRHSEQNIASEREVLAKHQMLYKALMEQLFSGRTRVP